METLEGIQELGITSDPKLTGEPFFCMSIIGQIEGHMILPPQNKTTKYEHIIPQLAAIEQNDRIKGLLFIMNTVGGDVEAGLAIAEMIATMSKPSVSLVLGGGHSIGIPLSVSAAYSYICPTATMTVHPIRMNGMVINVPKTFEYFDKMQERIANFIITHSHIKREVLDALMAKSDGPTSDVGTILIGEEAVRYGLIDAVGGLKEAMAKLRELTGTN